MAKPRTLPEALDVVGLGYMCGKPQTLGRCGGGSTDEADVVSMDSGKVEAGVEVRRSE
jgi:hypothetical protein